MKKSDLHHQGSIKERLTQLNKVIRNYIFFSSGQYNGEDEAEFALADLVELIIIKEDLEDLKEDLEAEPENCPECIDQIQKNNTLLRENIYLRKENQAFREKLHEFNQQTETAKMKVSK